MMNFVAWSVGLFFVGSVWCQAGNPNATAAPSALERCQTSYPNVTVIKGLTINGCSYVCAGQDTDGGWFTKQYLLQDSEPCGDGMICMGGTCSTLDDIDLCKQNAVQPVKTANAYSCVLECKRDTSDGKPIASTIVYRPNGTDCSLNSFITGNCDGVGNCQMGFMKKKK